MGPMNDSSSPISLSVSLVVYHSDLPRLLQTVDSLCESILHAVAAGNLRAASLVLVDNSEDDIYAAQVGEAVRKAVSCCPQLAFTQRRADSNLG